MADWWVGVESAAMSGGGGRWWHGTHRTQATAAYATDAYMVAATPTRPTLVFMSSYRIC
jgi:hypothetical protein